MIDIAFPVGELVDRYTIALLKQDKGMSNEIELTFYQQQIDQLDLSMIDPELLNLKKIHSEIWELEKELKSGREHNLSLEEIGRRALRIRDMNNQRMTVKNQIADKLACSIRESKKDHLSE